MSHDNDDVPDGYTGLEDLKSSTWILRNEQVPKSSDIGAGRPDRRLDIRH
jgi:hypothetical protein